VVCPAGYKIHRKAVVNLSRSRDPKLKKEEIRVGEGLFLRWGESGGRSIKGSGDQLEKRACS